MKCPECGSRDIKQIGCCGNYLFQCANCGFRSDDNREFSESRPEKTVKA